MIDASVYTKALETQLRADAGLAGRHIERSMPINTDTNRASAGWLGIYPGPNISSQPKSLGAGGSATWATVMELTVVVQACSFDGNGQVASDDAEALVQLVFAAVKKDLTLGIPGARVTTNSRRYMYLVTDDKETGDLFMPQVNITFKLEIRSA